jgi:hypothetical protein
VAPALKIHVKTAVRSASGKRTLNLFEIAEHLIAKDLVGASRTTDRDRSGFGLGIRIHETILNGQRPAHQLVVRRKVAVVPRSPAPSERTAIRVNDGVFTTFVSQISDFS